MRNYFFAIVVILIITGHYHAQEKSTNAFSEFTIEAGYTNNLSSGDIEEYWESGNAAAFSISTPFYFGTVGIGIDASIFESKLKGRPDFKTFFINLSWMKGIRLLGFSQLNAGVKVGSYNMLFDDNNLTEFESNESELAVSAIAQYDTEVVEELRIYLRPEFLTVFTNKRLKLFIITAGLSYTFNSPQWIRDILE